MLRRCIRRDRPLRELFCARLPYQNARAQAMKRFGRLIHPDLPEVKLSTPQDEGTRAGPKRPGNIGDFLAVDFHRTGFYEPPGFRLGGRHLCLDEYIYKGLLNRDRVSRSKPVARRDSYLPNG